MNLKKITTSLVALLGATTISAQEYPQKITDDFFKPYHVVGKIDVTKDGKKETVLSTITDSGKDYYVAKIDYNQSLLLEKPTYVATTAFRGIPPSVAKNDNWHLVLKDFNGDQYLDSYLSTETKDFTYQVERISGTQNYEYNLAIQPKDGSGEVYPQKINKALIKLSQVIYKKDYDNDGIIEHVFWNGSPRGKSYYLIDIDSDNLILYSPIKHLFDTEKAPEHTQDKWWEFDISDIDNDGVLEAYIQYSNQKNMYQIETELTNENNVINNAKFTSKALTSKNK